MDRETRKLAVDFVLHDGGVVADWAAHARPGHPLGIGNSRASLMVRNDLDFYILVGYETELPAKGRRIDKLSAGTQVKAFIEVASLAERQAFVTAADLDLTWVDRFVGHSLIEAVKPITTPQAHGYIFIAGEAIVSASLCDHFLGLRHNQRRWLLAPRRVQFYYGHEY